MSVKKKAKKKKVSEPKEVKDNRIWHVPTHLESKTAVEFSTTRVGKDFFKVGFFDRDFSPGINGQSNHMNCLFIMGASRGTIQLLRTHLDLILGDKRK